MTKVFFVFQVRGTIFNELDDDKLFSVIDFSDFEERFKIAPGGRALLNGDTDVGDGLMSYPSKRFKKPENVSLLEHTRLRNIGKPSSTYYFYKVFCSSQYLREACLGLLGNL